MRKYLGIVFGCALAACSASPGAQTLHQGPLSATVSPGISGETNTIAIQSDRVSLAAVSLEMTGMSMPAKRFSLHVTGAGRYETEATFAMSGAWHATVFDARGDRVASFPIIVR